MFLHEFEHKAAKAIFLEYGCLLLWLIRVLYQQQKKLVTV